MIKVTVTVDANGTAEASCEWKICKDNEMVLPKLLGGLLYMSTFGQLKEILIGAIYKNAISIGEKEVADMALEILGELSYNREMKPLIGPNEVFSKGIIHRNE